MSTTGEVTAADIARLAGVGRAAVSNWRKRHPDFPAPVGGSSSSPLFRLDDVEHWLTVNNRAPTDDPARRIRRALLGAGSSNPLVDEIPRLAQLLLGEPRPDWSTATRRNPPADPPESNLDGEVQRLVAEIGAVATFDLLLESFRELPAQVGVTSDMLARFMVTLANVQGRTVHDPACGTGALLAAAIGHGAKAVTGQDADSRSATMAQVGLALRPPKAKKRSADERTAEVRAGEVRAGDLRHDAYPGHLYDVVLCHPPFATRDWGAEHLSYDQRWKFGVPPRQESELAWIQHALAHTRLGGDVAILVPPAVATRGSGRRIRAELLRRGAVRAVLALPPGMAVPAHLSLQLWLLTQPAEKHSPGAVLLVDASTLERGTWEGAVIGLVRSALRHGAVSPDTTIPAAFVPVVELLDDDVDLTPARHLASRVATAAAADVLTQWHELAAVLVDLPDQLPTLKPTSDPVALPMTTVADLVRSGALSIHAQADTAVLAGDVVVPSHGTDLAVEVATAPGTLAPNRVVLRPDPQRLDPWFLAGFIARPSNVRLVSSLGSMHRLDIRRAQVPHISLDHQRDFAHTFAALHTFRRNLIAAAKNGALMANVIAEGLAAGTLHRQP